MKITTNYYGLYFWDSLDVTRSLTATAGGRYNYEEIDLRDQLKFPGSNLTGNHLYTRFNPVVGGPTARRRPRSLPAPIRPSPAFYRTFLVTDPNLLQVVSKTWQGGFRGTLSPFGYGRLNWTADLFRTENYNDIYNVRSPVIRTRGYLKMPGTR